MSCPVCLKHKNLQGLPGGVIFETDLVFLAHFPHIPYEANPHFGHLILELKRHIESPEEMTDAESQAVGLFAKRGSGALKLVLNAEHVYFFRIGDITRHLHFHLVPRYVGTPKSMWGTGLYQHPDSKKATERDAAEISLQLKNYRGWR